jgi:hypothetical protein
MRRISCASGDPQQQRAVAVAGVLLGATNLQTNAEQLITSQQ